MIRHLTSILLWDNIDKIMKQKLLFTLILIGLLALGCNQASPTIDLTLTPTQTMGELPDPIVQTTQIPDVRVAASRFLELWHLEDYQAMYALLSSNSKSSISMDDFVQKLNNVAAETTLKEMNYQILSDETIDDKNNRINYQISFISSLLGEIQRQTQLNLVLENGSWYVNWDDSAIMPELANGNILRMDRTSFPRADIFDRNGALLANQSDATAIGFYPDNVDPEFADDLISLLSRVSGVRASTIQSLVENTGLGEYLPVGQVDSNQSGGLFNALANYGAVILSNYTSRFYPQNGVAPHMVGYISSLTPEDIDYYSRLGYRPDAKIGRKGIENSEEETLAGDLGGTLYVVDPQGVAVSEIGSAAGQPGKDIYSTIDKDLQLGVQQALSGFRGAAVVLERDTGRVLAMASSPSFDPNAYQAENYNWLTSLSRIVNDPNLPEFNRSTQGLYPLGSVFKIITAAAALESGLYTADYTYDCQYLFNEVAGLTLNDWTYDRFLKDEKTPPSGLLTLPQGLIRSCNPFFWHLGKGLFDAGKTTAVADMARGFGLGSGTGIEVVEEQPGNVPNPQNVVDAVNLAIGQGDLQVTPLQVANFIAAIGNGGTLNRPQAIEKIVAEDGTVSFQFTPQPMKTLPLSSENLETIQNALRGVVSSNQPRGTAYDVFNGFRIPVAGKTGTATSQTIDPHAWFAGYSLAEREDKPDIAIAVIMENSGEGSEYAAPVFRRIMEYYFLGAPQKLYPWESFIGVTKTPTPLFYETPTPEGPIEP